MERETEIIMDGISRAEQPGASRSNAIRQALLRDRIANIGGLCGNCIHLESCTYPKAVSDTWFCEEYEFEAAEELSPQPELTVLNEKPDEKLGLCSNCELRESCKFPKPAGGVWFCGEYQ